MKGLRQFAFGIFAISFIASASVMSFAGDPPSRVARLNYISGQVSMQPGGVNDWATATINRPMTTADRLWTDNDSRTELQIGGAAMRMDSDTSLTFSNLTDNTVQLELDQGTLNLQVSRLLGGEIYEVDTPNMAFTIQKSGSYRFDVDSRGDSTLLTVWKGRGIATGSGDAVRIDSRKQVRFSGGMSMMHDGFSAPRFDGFDEWCQTRADQEARSISARYVSPEVVGYEDLDQYGYWRAVPAYGNVWFPTQVEAGWAPYRFGHWVWIDPWGWTWVDDAAWGFAPFHYGRWVTVAGTWAWVPGPVYVHPVYAPALVAWVGGTGISVGWFPLGYGEPYIPSYRVSRTYFETVNVSNTRITNITYVSNNYYNTTSVRINNIHYVNQTTAVTIVNNDVLVNSRRVDRDSWIDRDRDRRDDHNYRLMAGPSIEPSHQSVLGIHDNHVAAAPPDRVFGRHVVTNVKPPERPVAFDTRHPDADDHPGRPFNNDSRSDGDAYNGNQQGRPDWPDQHGNRDRDRGNAVAGDGRDNSRPSREGDDDRNNDRNDGRWSRGNQPEQNGNGNDGERRGTDNGVGNGGQSNGQGWARGQQNNSSADNGRFPHPSREGDDDRNNNRDNGRWSRGNQPEQNGNGNDGERRGTDNGVGNGGQSNGQGWARGQQNNSSADNGRFPHPGRQGNDDNGQQGNQNSNGNNGDRRGTDNGIGNGGQSNGQGWARGQQNNSPADNGRFPHPGGQGNDDNGQQGNQNANGNNGERRGTDNGIGNGGQSNGQGQARGQQNNSSAEGRFPHPSNPGNDNGQQQTGGGYQPAPKQADQNPNNNGNDSQGRTGNAGMSNSPNPNRGQQASGGGYQPAPKQADQNPNGNDGQRSNSLGNGRSSSTPPQTSSNSHGSGSQVVDRPMPRPSQAQNNDSHPAQPAPRMAQAQPAPHSNSHPAPSKAGSNGNAHGNALQDKGSKVPQEH